MADPGLQIGGGGRSPFGLKIRWGGGPPLDPPLDNTPKYSSKLVPTPRNSVGDNKEKRPENMFGQILDSGGLSWS